MFAQTKDGTFRFCYDYRCLSDMTVLEAYLISEIDECIDSLWHAKEFSILDAKSGYYQMLTALKSKHRTTLTMNISKYVFAQIPSGLKSTQATYERAIDTILATVKKNFSLVY